MTSAAVRDPSIRLQELLDSYPVGRISALLPDGNPAMVPDAIALGPGHVRVVSPGVAGYVPEDRPALLVAFDRTLRYGAAQAYARAINAPDISLSLHLVDMTAVYGVVVALSVVHDGELSFAAVPELPVVAPRVARIRKSRTAAILAIDEATTTILGWRPEDMVGRRSIEFVHPDDQHLAIEHWLHLVSHPTAVARTRLRHLAQDGSWIWFETSQTQQLINGEPCVVAEMVDISVEMAARLELEAREQLLYQLTQTLPLGVFQIDTEGCISYSNDRLFEVVGRPETNAINEQFALLIPEHQPLLETALQAVLHGAQERTIDVQLGPVRGGAAARMCQISMRPLQNHDKQIVGAVGCVADITESTMLRRELEHRATVDSLTDCLNRAAIMGALDTALADARNNRIGTAVIFIDLDSFKSVNDQLGHAGGDQLLTHAADTMQALVDRDASVGRVGGDEFLIVYPNVPSPTEALQQANRIASGLRKPVSFGDGSTITCSASIGVAWTNRTDIAGEALVADADAAMYEAKRRRDGQVALGLGYAEQPRSTSGHRTIKSSAQGQPVHPRAPHPSERRTNPAQVTDAAEEKFRR